MSGLRARRERESPLGNGVDLGYYDSMLIVADGDRRAQFEDEFEFARARIHNYEERIDSILTIEDFLTALGYLRGDPARAGG